MKKSRKKYIVLIAIGFLLTPSAVDAAFEARQALHFGSEWLLVPFFILIGLVVDSFVEMVKEVQKQQERSWDYDLIYGSNTR